MPEEMAKFRVAFAEVMSKPAMAAAEPAPRIGPRGMGGTTFLS
jgi:hypothetical protein